jgi:inorganic phosphate transporter, PiT family
MTLVLIVVFVALVFEYINGFHDTANSIATVVSTKVLTPRMAIALAAITNLVGALFGVAVAKTISSGLVQANFVTTATIVCALFAGIVWNLVTWWFGLPSSSTHALVGGLVGATVASAAAILPEGTSAWTAVIWEQAKPGAPLKDQGGILYKVIIPMIASPILGFVVGLLVMTGLYLFCQRMRPNTVNSAFGKLQIASAGYMGFSHGQADAQKTMGVIALALVGATKAGVLTELPDFLSFLRIESLGPKNDQIPMWIKVTCALVMCAGTAAGGWKIIKTMGHKMVKLLPVHGFAAETTAATVLLTAAHFGMPVSTTHAITTSIMGVGCAKRWSALKLSVISRILVAWVLTLPITALIAWLSMKAWFAFGWPVK